MHQIAVIGAGHWGPNLIRNFDNKRRSAVRWVVDRSRARLDAIQARFPGVRVATDAAEALNDPEVAAVVIATPTVTHYDLVRQALQASKHVFAEKPLTNSSATSQELVELAKKVRRVLLVGHVFLYNPAVQWVKRCITEGELGRLYYLSSQRTNLGPIRTDVSAAWDLASQDLSIFNYWLGAAPLSVSATGGVWINRGVEDSVFATLHYPTNIIVNLHVSWLNPRKMRDITVVGDRRMLTYDDMNLTEPLRLYDKRVADESGGPAVVDSFASFRSSISDGDIRIPRVAMGEPLLNECNHFLDCIEQGLEPLTGGNAAVVIVKTLEAIERSMRAGGGQESI